MQILVVEPEKRPYLQEIEGNLESMQAVVGGLIEPVYDGDCAIVVNEEGKISNLPFNRVLIEGKEIIDFLFGRFFICGVGEENFTDIPESAVERYSKRFGYYERLVKHNGELFVCQTDFPDGAGKE